MLPSEAQFAAAADALGVGPDDALVLYDNAGIFSSARAWWTWAVFGHRRRAVELWVAAQRQGARGGGQTDPWAAHEWARLDLGLLLCRVAVLDGGMPAWRAAGGEVETAPVDDAALHAAAEALRNPPPSGRCALGLACMPCCAAHAPCSG